MDVEKVVALVTAAGFELTDRRRDAGGQAWRLSFSNGADVVVGDDGSVKTEGREAEAIDRVLAS
jgi:hypothetical protein